MSNDGRQVIILSQSTMIVYDVEKEAKAKYVVDFALYSGLYMCDAVLSFYSIQSLLGRIFLYLDFDFFM